MIDFILDCMNVICVFAVMVFLVGIIAGKDTNFGKYGGLILPILMIFVTLITTIWTLNMTYFLLLAVPTGVLWFVYRVSRRSILLRKQNPDIEFEDEVY